MKQGALISCIWLCSFIACNIASYAQEKSVPVETLNEQQINELVNQLCQQLNAVYVFPEKAQKISAYLKQQAGQGVYKKLSDPAALALQLAKDMRSIHTDAHMDIRTEPGGQGGRPGPGAPEKRTDAEQAENYKFRKLEILPGNIGYLRFDGFTDDIKSALPVIEAAFRFLSHTQSLIIDLRYNGGGSVEMVSQIESYFFDKKTHMNDVIDRADKDTSYFYADPGKASGIYLAMPVYILTSYYTFSGAEDFSYGMQSVKRAITIGERTGGGAHPVGIYPLGHNLTARIPFARSLNPYTHTDWEGTGVLPDVKVSPDTALETALTMIYTRQLNTLPDKSGRGFLEWQLQKLQAKSFSPDTTLFPQYCGLYGSRFQVYTEHGTLYLKDLSRNNFTVTLNPMAIHVFMDNEYMDKKAEFIKDADGNITILRLVTPDGRVQQFSK